MINPTGSAILRGDQIFVAEHREGKFSQMTKRQVQEAHTVTSSSGLPRTKGFSGYETSSGQTKKVLGAIPNPYFTHRVWIL